MGFEIVGPRNGAAHRCHADRTRQLVSEVADQTQSGNELPIFCKMRFQRGMELATS